MVTVQEMKEIQKKPVCAYKTQKTFQKSGMCSFYTPALKFWCQCGGEGFHFKRASTDIDTNNLSFDCFKEQRKMDTGLARTRFNVLDVIQILSGLFILNAILSYWFTSSTVWGYDDTRYVNPKYIMFILRGSPMKRYTPASLLESQESNRLLLSINRKVFDVTSNREMYDPKIVTARYATFVGHDCTRMYINGCFKDDEQCTWDLRNTGYEDEWIDKTVIHWEEFYRANPGYWQVGYLDVGDESEYEIPKKCLNGIRYPSML